MYYILDDKHTPILVSLEEWSSWINSADRCVKRDMIGDVRISTVFLSVDLQFFLGLDRQYGDGQPLLFETMIFGGTDGGYCERCSTWEQAETMHAKALERVMLDKVDQREGGNDDGENRADRGQHP